MHSNASNSAKLALSRNAGCFQRALPVWSFRLSNRSRLHRLQAPRRMPHRPLALGKGLLQHGQAWSPAPQSRRHNP
ncbi:hypothetical protein PC116_g18462 [Phytophthora cactorum]|nr:hypothetical protein PC116_g18462 [Phytophthora cactorum]